MYYILHPIHTMTITVYSNMRETTLFTARQNLLKKLRATRIAIKVTTFAKKKKALRQCLKDILANMKYLRLHGM